MKLSKSLLVRCAASAVLFFTTICAAQAADGWRETLATELPRMGHRNFIVVADSAYPLQSAPGITTLATGAGHLEVLGAVLEAVEAAEHVQAVIHLDKELAFVTEEAAPGITELRDALGAALGGAAVVTLPHMDIIHKLDESAGLFNVLILKTDLTLPYTSVFIELDCGYWSAEKEAELRRAMGE